MPTLRPPMTKNNPIDSSIHPGKGGSRAAKKRRKQKINKQLNNNRNNNIKKQPSDQGEKGTLPTTLLEKGKESQGKATTSGVPSSALISSGQGGRGADDGTGSGLSETQGGAKRKRSGAKEAHASVSSSLASRHVEGKPASDGKKSMGERTRGYGSSSASREEPTPTVIDASAADERSRRLLELDVMGVLADPDVESGLKARQLLQWMIAPLPVEDFYDNYW